MTTTPTTRPATLPRTPFGARAGSLVGAVVLTFAMLAGIDALAQQPDPNGLLVQRSVPAATPTA